MYTWIQTWLQACSYVHIYIYIMQREVEGGKNMSISNSGTVWKDKKEEGKEKIMKEDE
jgi:hypothetical protein